MKRILILAAACWVSTSLFAHDSDRKHSHRVKYDDSDKRKKDSDASTVNGELVKVGSQNKYRKSFKRLNISTNPVGMILGSYGLSASYALNANFAVKVDLNFLKNYKLYGDNNSGFEFGVTAPIYFSKVYTDYYIEPGLNVNTFKIEDEENTVIGPVVFLGKHWMWDSGLNISAALGVGRNFGAEDDDFNDIFPAGYLRFGYAFDIK